MSTQRDAVVFVDDRVPLPGRGAGAPRARQHILGMAVQHDVWLHTREKVSLDAELTDAGVCQVDLDTIPYGWKPIAVVASRPNNVETGLAWRSRFPDAALIYDAEARFAARTESRLAAGADPLNGADNRSEWRSWMLLERRAREVADAVVAISESEADWFRGFGCGVHVVSPFPHVASAPRSSFADRSGAVFISSWDAGIDTPNGDALAWLTDEIIPAMDGPTPMIQVTGGGLPSDGPTPTGLRFLGHVPDLGGLLQSSRVAVAPIRFGAGVKLKVLDSLLAATPTVATRHGAEGLPAEWVEHMVVTDDPKRFAHAVSTLLTDAEAWTLSHAGLVHAIECWRGEAGATVWGRVLDDACSRRRLWRRVAEQAGAST